VTPADVFAERLLTKLETRQEELAHFLTHGQVSDFDRFCFLRGQIWMLDEVVEQIRELLGPMINADPFEGHHDSVTKGPHGPI